MPESWGVGRLRWESWPAFVKQGEVKCAHSRWYTCGPLLFSDHSHLIEGESEAGGSQQLALCCTSWSLGSHHTFQANTGVVIHREDCA